MKLAEGEPVDVINYRFTTAMPVLVQTHTYDDMTPLLFDFHEAIEVGIVLQGTEERHWQGYVSVAEPGDVWLCATWEPHGWRAILPDTRDAMVAFLPGYLGDEVFGEMSWLSLFAAPPDQRPRVDSTRKRERLLAQARELLEDRRQKEHGWKSGARLDLLKVLFTLSRGWRPPSALESSLRTRPGQLARVIPALRLVHSDPMRRVSLEEAAAACSLSRTQFCAIFKQSMGLAFGEFDLRARLAAAAKRLLDTCRPVDTIAEETGFYGASHLHRSFLARYGCTPARYREKARLVPAGNPTTGRHSTRGRPMLGESGRTSQGRPDRLA